MKIEEIRQKAKLVAEEFWEKTKPIAQKCWKWLSGEQRGFAVVVLGLAAISLFTLLTFRFGIQTPGDTVIWFIIVLNSLGLMLIAFFVKIDK